MRDAVVVAEQLQRQCRRGDSHAVETSARSVCKRNWPQAALISWPFSRRSVAATPCSRKIDKNFSCRLRDGRDHCKPSTKLYGIKFTFAESRFARFARICG